MFFAGCDVGSLTAEAVVIKGRGIVSEAVTGVRATAGKSAAAVMEMALARAGLSMDGIAACYSTGYGRFSIPFAKKNLSEISCHGMGAFWANPRARTVIDIGGQDCKVISLDNRGMVSDFVMNDKCAAGTGRSLEILAKAIHVPLEDLGRVSMKSRKSAGISNKCSIFMELEVLQHLYKKEKVQDIARGINLAVAKRVAALARAVAMRPECVLSGGVSKNAGVSRLLEDLLGIRFPALPVDPQIIGALGAAVFAAMENDPEQGAKTA